MKKLYEFLLIMLLVIMEAGCSGESLSSKIKFTKPVNPYSQKKTPAKQIQPDKRYHHSHLNELEW